jgi:hypothetical protein
MQEDLHDDPELAQGLGNLHAQLDNMNANLSHLNESVDYRQPEVSDQIINSAHSLEHELVKPTSQPPAVVSEKIDPFPRIDQSILLVKSGFLHKRGGKNAGWKRRHFLLNYNVTNRNQQYALYYYVKNTDKTPKGIIPLENADIIMGGDASRKTGKSPGNYEFRIEVQGGRMFELCAEKEKDRADWVQTLNNLIYTIRQHRIKVAAAKKAQQANSKVRGAADKAQNCEAFGPGLYSASAGQVATFTVQANDMTGAVAAQGGERFAASLQNDDLHYDLEVRDNEDGTYRVKYCTIRAGEYQLYLTLSDYEIYGSPFNLVVGAGEADAGHCIGSGEGLEAAQSAQVNYFTIVACDSFDNELTTGGADFQITLPEHAILQGFKDGGNGKYSGAYKLKPTATANMKVEISVTLGLHKDGVTPKHIRGSPFQPVVQAYANNFSAPGSAAPVVDQLQPSPQGQPVQQQYDTQTFEPVQQEQQQFANSAAASVASAMAATTGGMGRPATSAAAPSMTSTGRGMDASNVRSALEEKQREIEAQKAELMKLRQNLRGGAGGSPGGSPAGSPLASAAGMARSANGSSPSNGRPAGGGMSRLGDAAAAARAARGAGKTAGAATKRGGKMRLTPEIMSLFQKHNGPLAAVFAHYSHSDSLLKVESIFELAQDFDILPTFLSKRELQVLYRSIGAAAGGIDFVGFVDFLANCAFDALSKGSFAQLYPTDEAKVVVLLEMWGLGDPSKLDKIRQSPK